MISHEDGVPMRESNGLITKLFEQIKNFKKPTLAFINNDNFTNGST
jgi:hypothetical protein